MKRKLKIAAALMLGASMMVGNVLAANVSFTDVPSTHWAYAYVQKAAGEGLVTGVGGGLYGVDNKLSTADFSTMVIGMLYPDAYKTYAGMSSYWWYPYVEASYQKGLLTGTTAGSRRTADTRWTATVVEAGLSRYDMAQIIYNAAKSQGWTEPSSASLLLTMMAIPDWSSIPASYQNAVAYCYAAGYLSGTDDKGTFDGESTMTRAQAAVVLCAMVDAQEEIQAPTYTNRSGKLVNGKDANEENVEDALMDLKQEFYEYDMWETDRSYTSAKLGSATGSKAFAYMISDRVFGALPAETVDDPDDLKPGDLVYLDDQDQYVVVTSVSGDDFDYVMCNGFGVITWRESGSISDLGSRDEIYTRYEGENTGDLDEDAVLDLIDQFLDEEYDVGDTCDECDDGYKSSVFSNSTVYDDRAFAYLLSDYIFDDRDVESYDGDELDIDEIRPGDVIELYDEELYVVVTDVDTRNDEISYLYTTSSGKVREDYIDFNDLDWYDTIYTRYEGESSGSNRNDDTLSNGKDVTTRNVQNLIDEFLEDEYDVGDTCSECEDGYKSTEFYRNTVYDDRAFAYYMSDYIFGDLAVEEITGDKVLIDDVRIGDVIYLDDDECYGVVIAVEEDDDYVEYLYTSSSGRVRSDTTDPYDMDENDALYTRYPD